MPGSVLLWVCSFLFARGDGSTFSLVALGLMHGPPSASFSGCCPTPSLAVSVTSLSRSQITAAHYDVHCDAAVIGQARQIPGYHCDGCRAAAAAGRESRRSVTKAVRPGA